MKVACWSGPRNISTALMRSWSSRNDTFVSDEPFYSYYLKETGLNHPMTEKILKTYPVAKTEIIKNLTSDIPGRKTIWYQKHMAHHIVKIKDLSWLKYFQNCILIRHPRDVINSYVKKNKLNSVFDLGYPQQLMILDFLKREKLKFHVISSDNFLKNPKEGLKEWCDSLNIDFQSDMLSWEKGPHKNDGIWGIHWYDNINNSKKFIHFKKNHSDEYKKYKSIYDEAKKIYKKIYTID